MIIVPLVYANAYLIISLDAKKCWAWILFNLPVVNVKIVASVRIYTF